MKRMFNGFGVSFGILTAGAVSVFYAALIDIAIETIIVDLGIPSDGILSDLVVFLSLSLTNVAAYAFTSEIPMHITRKKNSFVQVLAHVLSSSVSGYISYLELIKKEPFEILPIDNVNLRLLVATLIIIIPFIIILCTITHRSREKKRPST